MSSISSIATLLVPVVLVLAAPPEAPQESPPASARGILDGPGVPDGPASLVQFDFQGSFVRVEGRPEEAALWLLPLDSARLEDARQALLTRMGDLGMVLVDRIDLVRTITDAILAGRAEEADALQRHLQDQLNPAHARDPLLDTLAPILTPDQRGDMTRMLDEYWAAWVDWELREAADRTPEARQATVERLSYELFNRELRQAYDASLRPYRQRLETIYAIAQPTDGQRAALRDAMIDLVRESRLRPTQEQMQRTARRVYAILDEERRVLLFERAFWGL